MARELAAKYKKEIFTVALILVAISVYAGIQSIYAALMTDEKDILSTSAPSTAANHEIWFKKTSTWAVDTTLVVEIDEDGTSFSIPAALDYTDIDLSYGTNGTETEATLGATAGTDTWGVTVDNSDDTITFILPSNTSYIPSTNDKVKIEIGTNASGGDQQITNPAKSASTGTADTYKILITYDDGSGGSAEDTGRAMVAIIEGVTVSATVAESLSFSIANVSSADCDSTFSDLSDATVTNTSVDFGTLTADTFTHGCQDLSVGTNASNGYSITSQESDQLTSSSNTIPDTTCDGSSCDESAAEPWTTATNYGFGHTCSTIDGTACNSAYSTGNSYRQFASIADNETAQELMGNSSTPTVVTEKGRVEYKVSVSNIQPAGTYTNTITYIATPNF